MTNKIFSKLWFILFSALFFDSALAQTPVRICSADTFSGHSQKIILSLTQGGNSKRFRTLKKSFLNDSSKNISIHKQAIDWLGLYRNLYVDIQGQTDSMVYITCHYDKADGNLFMLISVLLNGSLDFFLSPAYFSKGAYDNGTGCAVARELIRQMQQYHPHYTYRFLFTGQEEEGLRGSRRHVSGLSKKEWNKVVYAVNIDMIGEKGNKNLYVSADVSDSALVMQVFRISLLNHLNLSFNAIKKTGGTSDFESFKGQSFCKDFLKSFEFNLPGAFLPQRSYFTSRKKAVPVINFTDSCRFGISDMLSIYSPFSFGHEHSYKDKPSRIDYHRLYNYYQLIWYFLESKDRALKSNQ